MVTALLLLASLAGSPAPPSRPLAHALIARTDTARTLLWAIDGLSFDAFAEARTRGLFRRFQFAGRHIAPYPSMSHPSWTELTGARRLFGERANIRTVEARWFDLDAMRVADDPRQVFARQAAPFNYMRAFDWFADPLSEPLMYFKGDALPNKELADAEQDVLAHFTGRQYTVFIGGVDAIAHTQRGVLFGYLRRLDAMMSRVIDSLDHRGGAPVHHVIVSDHGNAGRFAEGAAESYLTPVSLTKAFRTARLVRRDTGALTAPNQAAVVTIALASMVNVYFADLARRRTFAEAAVQDSAVDLVTWLEVTPKDRAVVVLSRSRGESRVHFDTTASGAFVYWVDAVRGNPLALPASWLSTPSAPRWLSDSVVRADAARGPYPDALNRLVRSAAKEIENAPDLIVNLRDGFAFDGDFGKYVRMVRTHGALGARATFGLVATTHTAVPAVLRSSEVLGAVGLTPDSLYRRVLARVPRNATRLADSLAAAPARLGTGRDDESTDANFLRRVAPIVQSAGYFDASTLRALLTAARPDSAARRSRDRTLQRTRDALAASDVVKGVTTHVDALWRLTDSLPRGGDANADALRTLADRAERRLRTIPELAPLATLRDLWGRSGSRGENARGASAGGEPLRLAAMAAWSLPYFLNAVLDAPEQDSIDDPRDRAFAQRWHHGLRDSTRDSVRAMPRLLFGERAPAATLFAQVFAERQLLRRVESPDVPLLYNAPIGEMPTRDLTVLYVPGIFGELFDDEIWQRGLRALHDNLGLRIVQAGTDGRCSAPSNASRLLATMREDTERRLTRGYGPPRYLIVGYSKGGIDAAEALVRDPEFAGAHVAGLVTIASPHGGSPVAERTDLPDALLQAVIARPRPASCDTTRAVESLWPANRAAFWNGAGRSLDQLVPLASVSLASDMARAHPWMKITKRIAHFSESNDGVVARSASRFPDAVHAIDLGEVAGDHIAGRVASDFPQEAFLEAVVLTLNELGWFSSDAKLRWVAATRAAIGLTVMTAPQPDPRTTPREPAVREARTALALPGHIGWRADRTYKMSNLEALADRDVPLATRTAFPDGVTLWCDQRDMTAFREEYEFLYDAGNGGGENTLDNGFAMVDADGTARGRACRLRTHRSAMKMTTASLRFRPSEFSHVEMRMRVVQGVRGVAPNKGGRGKNDAALKVWIVLRDGRPGAGGKPLLFGYMWAAADADGAVPAVDSLVEASASRRRIGFSTLPEAWLVFVGGPTQEGHWVDLSRNLARDIARAFPGIPLEALQVAAITIQTDSDDSRGDTEVLLERLTFRPSPP
jgi:hypothetical protein